MTTLCASLKVQIAPMQRAGLHRYSDDSLRADLNRFARVLRHARRANLVGDAEIPESTRRRHAGVRREILVAANYPDGYDRRLRLAHDHFAIVIRC